MSQVHLAKQVQVWLHSFAVILQLDAGKVLCELVAR